MAKQSNIFSVLSLIPTAEGEEKEQEGKDKEKESSMPPCKQHLSKKKRRKAKKENSVDSLQLFNLRIHEDSERPKMEATLASPCLDRCESAPLPSEASTGKEPLRDPVRWPLVWIDLEMTGLDLEADRILEIACVITDGKLLKLIEGPHLIIHQSEQSLAGMGEWCQTHHAANGLIEAVRQSSVTEREAEDKVVDFVVSHCCNETKQPLLAGNSVYVDFMFLQKYMPRLAALFPHVVVDVSSIKALCLRWFPKDAERAPAKKKTHRAMDDIKESIAELKYMQKTIFKESRR